MKIIGGQFFFLSVVQLYDDSAMKKIDILGYSLKRKKRHFIVKQAFITL